MNTTTLYFIFKKVYFSHKELVLWKGVGFTNINGD